jgi:molybdopterin-containing oxidoreductase family iron-sulfur binding subunit
MAGQKRMSERLKSGGLDLVQIQAAAQNGEKRLWRSLDELGDTPEFRAFLHNEFPHDPAKDEQEGFRVNRRDVLKLMGASAALAGLGACTKLPDQKIVPYVNAPEQFIPGKPLFYATGWTLGGSSIGLLAWSHMGRPTKIEGNPDHPTSAGATDILSQASILTLYDPDRSQTLLHEGRIANLSSFILQAGGIMSAHRQNGGAGFRLLTETIVSPSLADQIKTLLNQFPQAKWYQYEPLAGDGARAGTRQATGQYANAYYRFDRADRVLSLDADFLACGPLSVRYSRDFADKRRMPDPQSMMNRLYVVESMMTSTGALADHRLALRSSDIEAFARAVAAELGAGGAAASEAAPTKAPPDWIAALARDLQAHRGASIVIAGDHQPASVHALAHAMNAALGNLGKTVVHTDPLTAAPANQMQSLGELVAEMRDGAVETLVVIGANPVYSAPANLEFRQHFLKVKNRIHLGLYNDETGELCHWHVPELHYLETWSDGRAHDGTVTLTQPLIAPLYEGKSAHELMAILLGQDESTSHDIVRGYWSRQNLSGGVDFEAFWEKSLHDGVIAGTKLPERAMAAGKGGSAAGGPATSGQGGGGQNLEVVFRPDPSVWDGRFANNSWLQETPRPVTRLTWDNAAMLSLSTAQRLKVNQQDVVKLRYQGREVKAPVFIVPGHADDSITVHLGYGRKRAGRVGTGVGFNAYELVAFGDNPWIATGVEVQKTSDHHHLVTTQNHNLIDVKGVVKEAESVEAGHRDVVRVGTLEEYRSNPTFAADEPRETTEAPNLYAGFKYNGYAWAMSIDLNSCVGCNACVVACRSENNIPVVGKEQTDNGRQMDWIRVDSYFEGAVENPRTYFEVVPCQQCEYAPCEYVCPVAATMHSPEGLNEMIYNRCVGTRYCSNNCPYKVRRFNFELFSDYKTANWAPLRNPNVTVRSRGVMEKCTYCIQRINTAKFEAEKQDRVVRDGEIVTACEQACPTKAIVFGDQNDPHSRVSKLKAQPRKFSLLAELNSRPRTTYLARLRNPNPEIKE